MESKIMIFKPSYEEFRDFHQFVKFLESQEAHRAGIAKIIPPSEWKARSGSYNMAEIGNTKIPEPIYQFVKEMNGAYEQTCDQRRQSISVRDFREMVESDEFCKDRPPLGDNDKVVSAYWDKVITSKDEQRIYGADINGSLMDANLEVWNIGKLGSILETVSEESNFKIEGVNTAYLYFGSWKTSFAWHVEDMDLYSINYLHFGAPKTWYAIPPSKGRDFERVAADYFPEYSKICNAFLRHKTAIISPDVLKSRDIPFDTITQEAGEIIITFPYGYHAGFNQGFNCAEATNFATERWIEYGKRCAQCSCDIGSVEIPMEPFVRKFQHDKYENWLRGRDIGKHPEVPGEQVPANLPAGFVKTTPRNGQKIKKRAEPLPVPELADDDEEKENSPRSYGRGLRKKLPSAKLRESYTDEAEANDEANDDDDWNPPVFKRKKKRKSK
ncbi:probable lysine-specific demethylase 4B [Cloeon dipterum]|uniref:probable lysine-specific demethylase 4B n=1 Tax=Cloeon dipterum TaxID=197152 RepID=UPI00321FC09C